MFCFLAFPVFHHGYSIDRSISMHFEHSNPYAVAEVVSLLVEPASTLGTIQCFPAPASSHFEPVKVLRHRLLGFQIIGPVGQNLLHECTPVSIVVVKGRCTFRLCWPAARCVPTDSGSSTDAIRSGHSQVSDSGFSTLTLEYCSAAVTPD